MFDVDHFKRINDTHGHGAGDEALREVADAVRVAERMRREVAAFRVRADGKEVAVTCSCGVAGRSPDTDDLDAFMRVADEALYCAKKDGRDRVVRQR